MDGTGERSASWSSVGRANAKPVTRYADKCGSHVTLKQGSARSLGSFLGRNDHPLSMAVRSWNWGTGMLQDLQSDESLTVYLQENGCTYLLVGPWKGRITPVPWMRGNGVVIVLIQDRCWTEIGGATSWGHGCNFWQFSEQVGRLPACGWIPKLPQSRLVQGRLPNYFWEEYNQVILLTAILFPSLQSSKTVIETILYILK